MHTTKQKQNKNSLSLDCGKWDQQPPVKLGNTFHKEKVAIWAGGRGEPYSFVMQ